ncbi:hypothetical protein WR25_16703 [Diploscapter pachys]|uniref:SUN domain-containing protein n=1 Tax=Diploscapter pachys TaxID=2018661 RepID=A0A2A2LUM0_9BILA|nr:hypothetical protein WR25_16703 [Diploscapter pachys]
MLRRSVACSGTVESLTIDSGAEFEVDPREIAVGLYNYRPISLVTSSVSGRQEEKQRVPTELERIADVGRRKDARLVGRTYSDDISGGYRFLQFVYRLQIEISQITLRVKRAITFWTSRIANWIDSFRLIQRLSDWDEEDEAVHRHVSIKENKFVQRKETNWTTDFSRSEPAPLYRLENVAALHRGAFVIPEHSASLPQNNFFYDIFGFNQHNKNSYQALLNTRSKFHRSDAFCFRCSSGDVTIRLSRPARPVAFEYEHIHWFGRMHPSAPKTFNILRCNFAGSECDEQNPLAKCRYVEVDGGVRQVCYPSDVKCLRPIDARTRILIHSEAGFQSSNEFLRNFPVKYDIPGPEYEIVEKSLSDSQCAVDGYEIPTRRLKTMMQQLGETIHHVS